MIFNFHAPALEDEDETEESEELEEDDEDTDEEEELPAEPNISICANHLSMQLVSRPKRIGALSLIFHIVAVRIFNQLNVVTPTQIESSNASSKTLSAGEI